MNKFEKACCLLISAGWCMIGATNIYDQVRRKQKEKTDEAWSNGYKAGCDWGERYYKQETDMYKAMYFELKNKKDIKD